MMNSDDHPLVSIIIVTMDRAELLKLCLEHIALSSYTRQEVFVIDGTVKPQIIKENRQNSEAFGAAYYNEPKIGLSKGRNLGIRMSHGDILIFLDDDILITKDAIKHIVPNFTDHQVMACSGRILPFGNNEFSTAQQCLGGFDPGKNKYRVTSKDLVFSKYFKCILYQVLHPATKIPLAILPPPLNIGPFSFFPFRKEFFSLAGMWDESLGGGTPAGGAEDTEIAYRVLKSGYATVYEPKAEVYHAHRQTCEELYKAHSRTGTAERTLLLKYKRDPYHCLLWVAAPLNHAFHMLKAFVTHNTFSSKLEWAYIKGYLTGPKRNCK